MHCFDTFNYQILLFVLLLAVLFLVFVFITAHKTPTMAMDFQSPPPVWRGGRPHRLAGVLHTPNTRGGKQQVYNKMKTVCTMTERTDTADASCLHYGDSECGSERAAPAAATAVGAASWTGKEDARAHIVDTEEANKVVDAWVAVYASTFQLALQDGAAPHYASASPELPRSPRVPYHILTTCHPDAVADLTQLWEGYRARLVLWAIQVTHNLRYASDVLELAVALLDVTLANKPYAAVELQRIMLACLTIATTLLGKRSAALNSARLAAHFSDLGSPRLIHDDVLRVLVSCGWHAPMRAPAADVMTAVCTAVVLPPSASDVGVDAKAAAALAHTLAARARKLHAASLLVPASHRVDAHAASVGMGCVVLAAQQLGYCAANLLQLLADRGIVFPRWQASLGVVRAGQDMMEQAVAAEDAAESAHAAAIAQPTDVAV